MYKRNVSLWSRIAWLPVAACLSLACGGGGNGAGTSGAARVPVADGVEVEQVLRWNNLGVAQLERHRYRQALEQFEKVTAGAPDWYVGHLNLGIALMNLRRSDEALAALDQALMREPAEPRAAYCQGLIHRNAGESAPAIAAFQRLVEAGIEDSDLFYNLGLLHFREKRSAEAAEWLRRAIDLDEFNASAQFKLASVLLDLGRRDEADVWMNRFRALQDSGSARTAGQQYTEQGPYAEAIGQYGDAGVIRSDPAPDRIRFVEASAAAGVAFRHRGPGSFAAAGDAVGTAALRRYGSGVAWGDVDADGDPDLFLPNLGGPDALYRNRGDGTFEEVAAAAGVADAGESMAAYFGDYDNDDDADLFVAGLGGDRLYRNDGDGSFTDVTGAAGLGGDGASMGAAWADVDHDGDLDLYVTVHDPAGVGRPLGGRPNRLHRNNGDGTFTERAVELGIGGDRKQGLGALFSDFDNDRDIDLLFWSAAAPPELQSNLRADRYLDLGPSSGLPAGGGWLGAVAADLDKDGWTDLVLTGRGRPVAIWNNLAGRGFTVDEAAAPLLRPTGGWHASTGAQVADFDNDGFLDLVVVGEDGRGAGQALLLRNRGRDGWEDATAGSGLAEAVPAAPRGVALADYDRDGDIDILISANGGPVALLENRTANGHQALTVTLRGLGSNHDGIGAKVEVQAGGLWQRQEVSGGSGYLSQNEPRLSFGLGDRGQADTVRLVWPSGVLQAEMEKPAGEPVEIEELDRKGSSCPTLFAWNGERFEFVSDLLGVGGIGFLVQPWTYVRPDPTEYLKLDPVRIRPLDGQYRIAFVGQLEEVIYLDAARLIAVDHPAGVEVFPDERFATGADRPSGKIHRVTERHFPVAARDGAGRDLRDRLLRVDRRYADGFELLSFAGYAETHQLDLEFSDLPAAERWVLYLHGWVDYEYSSSTLAAHQAGIDLMPPVIEILDRSGRSVRRYPGVGFPAGMPKMMTWELPDPPPDGRFTMRITTNMRIYFDQAFLAPARDEVPVQVHRLAAAEARLRPLGFPREFSPDGGIPLLYDYHLAGLGFPWKRLVGNYTRFGEVRELVEAADDRFVIMGPGEEVRFGFDAASLPPPPAGWERSFLFFADGFCKDMDPNTAHPDTVEPLPFHAMSEYPYPADESYPADGAHRDYRRKWNTRQVRSPY